MRTSIKIFIFIGILLYIYFFVFTGEKTIIYYSNNQCTLTRIIYQNWGDTWSDLYYGRIDYNDIDESKCFIRCEVRGGLNGNMKGYIIFHGDSIFIAPSSGAFFKYNCNNDKLFLLEKYYHLNNVPYFDYGFPSKEIGKKYGIEIIKLQSQKTTRFFNTLLERNACAHFNSVECYPRENEHCKNESSMN